MLLCASQNIVNIAVKIVKTVLQQLVLHQAAQVLREEGEGGDEQTAAQDHHRCTGNIML